MIISTFNANSIRSRLGIILEWLEKNKPDVLCIQETKVQDEDFPCEPIEKAGYYVVFSGQKSYNGVAVISRHKPANVSAGLDSEPKDKSRLLRVKVKGISIVNTYVPQGFEPDSEKFDYKLEWFDRLLNYFQKHFVPEDNLLWMGDFNIAPEAKDVYDPVGLMGSVCYHPAVQEKLKAIMNWGFTDCFRKHCDRAGQYTFFDYRLPNAVKRNLGWRLDFIMATEPLARRCVECRIDMEPRLKEKPSDHTFVVAKFTGSNA